MAPINKNDNFFEGNFTYDFMYLIPPLGRNVDWPLWREKTMNSWKNFSSAIHGQGPSKGQYIKKNPGTVQGTPGPEAVVLHWTDSYNISSLDVLRRKGSAYHFLIDVNGTIIQPISLNRRAAHAGTSWGPRGNTWTDNGCLNDYAIGISFIYTPQAVYRPKFTTDTTSNEVAKINPKQLLSAAELIIAIKKAYPSVRWVCDHMGIVPWNKSDIYYFHMSDQGSPLGHKFVTDINIKGGWSGTNDKLTWWKTGDNWIDCFGNPKTLQSNLNNLMFPKTGKNSWRKKTKGSLGPVIMRKDKGTYRPYDAKYLEQKVKDYRDQYRTVQRAGNGLSKGTQFDANFGVNDIAMEHIP